MLLPRETAQEYAQRITDLSDYDLVREIESEVHGEAVLNSRGHLPRVYTTELLFAEAIRRGKGELYTRGCERARRSAR